MKIAVIGVGYVGLVSGACFSDTGLNVCCIDSNPKRVEDLQNGIIPIYEPGLDAIVKRNTDKKRLTFTTSLKEGIADAAAVFIAVGTPMGPDGFADLSAVYAVAHEIGKSMESDLVIVDKSTVPVGTAQEVTKIIEAELAARQLETTPWFEVVSNPEFLKEGVAIEDFTRPDRIVIGVRSTRAEKIMREIYRIFTFKSDRMIIMDPPSAELTKYASNCMLATKISFINEIARVCEAAGADINAVRRGLCADTRIGNAFLYPGCGYGGSCFPKDVNALVFTAAKYGIPMKLLTAVDEVNRKQKELLFNKISERFHSLKGMTFAVWGLSFKPNTDDMRDAPSLITVPKLVQAGAIVRAYDPVASENAQKNYFGHLRNIEYSDDMYAVLDQADALIIHTEWREFRMPDLEQIAGRLKQKIIFDGRNIFPRDQMQTYGFEYHCIGVRAAE